MNNSDSLSCDLSGAKFSLLSDVDFVSHGEPPVANRFGIQAAVLNAIDRLGPEELITAADLAERLQAPVEAVELGLRGAVHFNIASLHGQPGAWYYGRKNGMPVYEPISIEPVPNRRAGIVFMHPDETEIVVLDNKQIEMKDEFNEVILTPAVAKKLLEALGFIGGY